MTEEQAKELARLKGMCKGLNEAWDIALRIDSIHELRAVIAKRAMEQSTKYYEMVEACLKEMTNA